MSECHYVVLPYIESIWTHIVWLASSSQAFVHLFLPNNLSNSASIINGLLAHNHRGQGQWLNEVDAWWLHSRSA